MDGVEAGQRLASAGNAGDKTNRAGSLPLCLFDGLEQGTGGYLQVEGERMGDVGDTVPREESFRSLDDVGRRPVCGVFPAVWVYRHCCLIVEQSIEAIQESRQHSPIIRSQRLKRKDA